MEQILELLKSTQEELRTHETKIEEAETDRKATQGGLLARMDTNTKAI
jgi:hypothetical protein